jgi:peptidoglycan hydrolase-like protein with peptidoglycan-binding domain
VRKLALACLVLLAALVPGTGWAGPEKRVALVIGVARYQNAPALANPANDARLVGPALKKLGFDVQIVVDPTYETFKDALRDFGRRLDGARVALFYYAGHGLQAAGRNYLLPVNATLSRETDLRYEAFDVQAVLDEMDTPGRINLIFLDACRDNPFARSLASSMGGRSSVSSRGLAAIDTQSGGALIAFATAPGDVASDGDTDSPFTTALVHHIATPGLDIRQMLTRVRADVQTATSGRQRPWVNESLDADFYFVPRPEPAAPAVPEPGVGNFASPEIVFWQSIVRSRDPADFEAYIQQFPQGSFAALARLRLASLSQHPDPGGRASPPSEEPAWAETERRAVQTDLAALGHYRGPINGDLASGTRPAIRTWQSFEGEETTGRLTDEQRDRIRREARDLAAVLQVEDTSPNGTPRNSLKGATARFSRAVTLERGVRQPKDLVEAAYWYALAAGDGWAAAFTNLGTLRARAPKPDLEAARRLWLAAAAREETTALFNLGALAEKGIGGPVDTGLARRWYSLGADHKDTASAAALKRLGS